MRNKMPTRTAFLTTFCVAAALARPACATSWITPLRPLTAAQWLEYDLSGADAVGLGHVVGVTDTIVDLNPKDGAGFSVRSLTLRVEKWLKGKPRVTPLRVGVSPLDPDPIHAPGENLLTVSGTSRLVLIMLRSTPEGWGLCDGPDPAGVGLRLVSPADAAALERQVRGIVARQAPESLLAQADLVVIARSVASRPCRPDSNIQCVSVTPDTILAGSAGSREILVFMPLLGDVPRGQGLYLLQKTAEGYYALLGYQAGSQALHDGRTRLWKLSTTSIRERLRRLGRAGAQ